MRVRQRCLKKKTCKGKARRKTKTTYWGDNYRKALSTAGLNVSKPRLSWRRADENAPGLKKLRGES